MNEMPMEKKINHSEQEPRKPELETNRGFLELRGEVDQLRLELTALKEYMKIASPSFAEQFPHLLEKVKHDASPGTH